MGYNGKNRKKQYAMINTRKKSIFFLLLAAVILVIILFNVVLYFKLLSTDYEYRWRYKSCVMKIN